MRFGLIVLAAASVPLAAFAASAQQGGTDFAYAPGTHHYRLTTEVHREQVMGGGRAPFEFDVTTTQLVTVRIAPDKPDTLRLEITVDSVAVSSQLNAPAPDVRRLFGAKLTGLISPQGRVYSFDPPAGTTDSDLAQLYTAFRRFLVSLPPKPLHVGQSWADTVNQHVTKDGFDVVARAVTTSRVAGDTTINGQLAWRIARHTDIVQSGESRNNGSPVKMQGDGSANGVHFVSHDGVYLGSQSTQRLDIMMKNDISETPPISQTIKSKVESIAGTE